MGKEKHPNTFSEWMRPLLTAFFVHWRLVLFVPVACVILAFGACILLPSLYSGGFSLLVKAPEIERTSPESGTSVVMRPGLVQGNVIADEIKILQSHELFVNVAKALVKEGINVGGFADALKTKYLTTDSTISNETINWDQQSIKIEALAAGLEKLCVVAPATGSDIIEVTIQHYDPRSMRLILDHYLTSFYQLREAVWFNTNASKAFQTASDNYYRQWQNLLNERVVLKQETSALDPTREKEVLIEKQAANAAEIYDLQATLRNLQNQLDRLKTRSPMQSLTFIQQDTANDKLFSELKLQISLFQAQRAKLLGDFNQQAPRIKKIDYQLEALYRKYYRQLFSFIENKMAHVRIRIDVLHSGMSEVKEKLVELAGYENRIQLLDKKIELYRKHYFDHGNKAMEIEQQKDLRKNIATVKVVSHPFVSLEPYWPRVATLVPLAFVLGLFLSLLGIVFLRSMKNAYLLPEEISRDLNLPVLASFLYRKPMDPSVMLNRTHTNEKDLQWLKLSGSGIKPDLMAQWHDLLNRADSRDPFLTPQWLLPWLKSGDGRNQLLAAFRGKRLIFLMPIRDGLFLKQMGGFLESEQQDLALICRQVNAGELVGPMLTFTKPSFIRLDAMQKHQSIPLVAHCEAAGWEIVTHSGKQSPYVKIACDWETYWRERKAKVRKKYSRCSLKIQQDLSARTILATTIEEVNQWLPAMVRLEQNSWKSATGIFCPANIEQTRQRLLALAEADKLRLFILAADRRLLAYNVTLFHQKRLWYYNTAFNAEYKDFCPGIHLMVEMIKYGFDYNLHSVEMLGGRHDFKMKWTKQWRQRTTVYLFSPGLGTTIGTAGLRFFRFVKSGLKRSHGT